MDSESRPSKLCAAFERHQRGASPFYDEVVQEVAERAASDGSVGKTEIGALVAWKRLDASTRWVQALMCTPDAAVRAATATAREHAIDTELDTPSAASGARSALSPLPGFGVGDAIASAVIYALAPTRMAVYVRRAQAGLEALNLRLSPKPGRYSRYMALIEQLAAETAQFGSRLTAREVDLGLYTLGGPQA